MSKLPFGIEGNEPATITLDKSDLMIYLAGMFGLGFLLALLAFSL